MADAEFTWSSADESVVTVAAAGLATAVGNGTASVTASVESVTGTAEVTVVQRTGLGMDIGTEDESFGTIRCLNSDSDT